MEPAIGKELYKVIDALVALKVDLGCDPHIPGEILVLSAEKSRDACEALDVASTSIRNIATALGEAGQSPRH
jgi:hypothetical protein